MKAAVVSEVKGAFEVLEIAIDNPAPQEVLIDVRASGLCHSDLHVASNDVGFPMPAVLGHEISGVVAALGSAVTGLAVGDHVVTSPVHSCGACSSCRAGRPYQCRVPSHTNRAPGTAPRLSLDGRALTQFIGVGGFAEQVLVHQNTVVPVPREIPFDKAALLGCGVVTGAGAAINTARIRPGDTVVVIGAGGVGLNVIQGARLAGASRIIAVDLQPAKLELATVFGATDVINGGDSDAVAEVLRLTGGGVTHAFEVIGLKRTTEQAVAMLEVGGTAYLIGVHQPGSTIDITPFGDLMGKQKGIRGVAMGSSNIAIDIPMYANLYLQGRFKLDELVSSHIGLDGIEQGYQSLRSGAVARSVITRF
ncbi:Zn-dependent alcohol dehydrogenase [Paeniglutamicibacter sp. ZC-3]|uniref:Zn-dependent alcohol dehydrogenase n=1 Tax=Paeniglutamicibacter sp. ZC-3 TaxID=2986919 RepID=UPI0021F75302|nr:Zn-dependent alcohol dehydrogenase [Paeniglutamicibacter sp. ZC-3]MCV9994255.1 Zn-dependent alcohol dehydrogenase [Paeniglutamicibacter sp. ZC-3]